MRVLMFPFASSFRSSESGIKRVVQSYHKYARDYGIEYVECGIDELENYDLLSIHAGTFGNIPSGVPLVAHCHGLYWTADYLSERWELRANADVINVLRHANKITVPSDWVAETIRRDMRLNPYVVGHGIEWDEWQHDNPNEGYVLWNKNRNADVCDPIAVGALAKKFRNQLFATTFAPDPVAFGDDNPNIVVIGLKAHDDMKRILQSSAVYLSTTRETFGIGVLEAMASGVPVLGFAHGGNLQLVEHGVNGYLAQPGNYTDLEDGLEYCLKYRDVLGANGRDLAKKWNWSDAVEKVAEVYRAAIDHERQPATVSVVIPSYNYGTEDKLGRAIKSALAQTYPPKEIIVVDDGSDDNGATEQLVKSYQSQEVPVTYIRQNNQGVAVARNTGISHSRSKYVIPLDADDAIAPLFIEACIPDLERDRSLGIAYTRLQYITPDGDTGVSPWPNKFDYDRQLQRANQIPTCCVMRREMWERLGGYKQRYAPHGAGSEDAEFWTRCGAYGWGAKLVTDEPFFIYSWLSGRVSGDKDYHEVDWLGLHPWVKDGRHPFASVSTPKNGISHLVRAYDEPLISVIIPVGPNHTKEVTNALDSLESQTFRRWEVIIVDDTGGGDNPEDIEKLKAYPYVRTAVTSRRGSGAARNVGALKARAPLLLFLDADDWLYPEALQKMYDTYTAVGAIIYTDYVGKAYIEYNEAKKLGDRVLYYDEKKGEAVVRHMALDYDYERAVAQPRFPNPYIWCLISSLVPKKWHDEIGGFDESMASWEDWDYWIRMAQRGKCFVRIPEDLMVYRFYTGTRRETGLQEHRKLVEYLLEKYEGVDKMPCNCKGNSKSSQAAAAQQSAAAAQQSMEAKFMSTIQDSDVVMVLYDSLNRGQHRVVGMSTGKDYGYRAGGERFYVHKSDIAVQPHLFKPIEQSKVEEINPEPTLPPPPTPVKSNGSSIIPRSTTQTIPAHDGELFDLQTIPGVTDQIARHLNYIGVHDPSGIMALGVDGLVKIKGIGQARAEAILAYLQTLQANA